MKKYLCFLLAGLLLLSMTACGAPKDPEPTGTEYIPLETNAIPGTDYTFRIAMAEDAINTTLLTVERGLTDIQTIRLEGNDWFVDAPVFIDITFDGETDILIPIKRLASGVFFAGYVWDTSTKQFVHSPGLDLLPNIAVDKENQVILFCRTADKITNYGMYRFNTETKDFEYVRSLYWEPCEGGVEVVEKRYSSDREGLVNRFTAPSADGLFPDKTDANMAQYYVAGSMWDLDGAKWKDTVYKP